MTNHERRDAARLVLSRYINCDLSGVIDFVSLDDQGFEVLGINFPKFFPGNAGVEKFGGFGIDVKLTHFPFGNVFVRFAFGGGFIDWADEIITYGINWWVDLRFLIEVNEGGGAGGIEGADWWLRPLSIRAMEDENGPESKECSGFHKVHILNEKIV
jgi:hypothetical protein